LADTIDRLLGSGTSLALLYATDQQETCHLAARMPSAIEMSTSLRARCCIAGGGPAGMMLGLMLARAGINVIVLEKHPDFLRDFRGDTIHPSTLQVIYELGLLEAFLALPHDEERELSGQVHGVRVPIADFTHLSTRCQFLAFMPQWDFLNFVAAQARCYQGFRLFMPAEATDLFVDRGTVRGLVAATAAGRVEVDADLIVGADGRHSTIRDRAGLTVEQFGVPIDVLWFKLPKRAGQVSATAGYVGAGHILVMLARADYWQCGLVIAKGSYEQIKAGGLSAFRQLIAALAPEAATATEELADWDAIKLLTVQIDRLQQWCRPGLLCIGDAAHAMSPIGGVGINLAIQDAVAACNLLAPALRAGPPSLAQLQRVQTRRELPTRITQRFQIEIQNRVIRRVLAGSGDASAALPWPLRLLQRYPLLRRIPARLIGVGFRPEHVRTAAFSEGAPTATSANEAPRR
jgi:2-polyprenyl-6-methoxyphenol hydroxylase-like FAD-dependent oxidoreductase